MGRRKESGELKLAFCFLLSFCFQTASKLQMSGRIVNVDSHLSLRPP